jgi:hypothetical protein
MMTPRRDYLLRSFSAQHDPFATECFHPSAALRVSDGIGSPCEEEIVSRSIEEEVFLVLFR